MYSATLAAVTFQPGTTMIHPPRSNVFAFTMGTGQGPIFPTQLVEVGLTRLFIEQLV